MRRRYRRLKYCLSVQEAAGVLASMRDKSMLEEDMMQARAQELARLSKEVGRLSACILELRRQTAEA